MSDKPWWIPADGFDDMPSNGSAPDEEYGEDYLKYQLQCAFEDLCGLIGFERTCQRLEMIVKEHLQMLKRQGKH